MGDKNAVLTGRGTVAVMDLGTNTFHLLIARGDAANPEELFHITEPVRLGEGGINNGIIQPAAYARGVETMQKFHQHMLDFKVDGIKATATSALRTAKNGMDFINEVKAKTGVLIETIDGVQEAKYIYDGVKAGKCLTEQNSLVLDIGGGSVEFILGNINGIQWKQSFEIGAARMLDKFHQTDPIPGASIQEMNHYLEQMLKPVFEATANVEIEYIIGSSGSFETFAEVIELKKGNEFELKNNRKYTFDPVEFINITDWFIESTHFERENTPGVIPIRVDMIVSASIITRFVMKQLGIEKVMMSTYSLKEGVLAEMLS